MRATASGSLPGTDFRGTLTFCLELFPAAAPLPELPARGPGSQMVGRAAALLADMPVELTSQGWQLSDHAGIDHRRAVAQWRHDLDDLEELAQGFTGTLKVAVCGPWTLAALLGRARAEVALADPGARRDLAQSLWAGVSGLLADILRRLPDLSLLLQVDEPMLPAVLGGQVKTASGYRTLRSVDVAEVADGLRLFSRDAVLHCCAPGADWIAVADRAGFAAPYAHVVAPEVATIDALAGWLDSGRTVVAGVLDSAAVDVVPGVDSLVHRTLSLPFATDSMLIAPACGLAGWGRSQAADALRALDRARELATERLH